MVGIVEEGIAVEARRIDELMDLSKPVAVMKIDVEGYKDKALVGMEELLLQRLVKNIVLELSPAIMGVECATKMRECLYVRGFSNIIELYLLHT